MELVIISKSKGAVARLPVRNSVVALGVILVAGCLLASAYLGYQRGVVTVANDLASTPEFATSIWQQELQSQRHLLERMRSDMQTDISTLAVRAGTLQAHVTRLDALAQRLVDVANLDAAEFDLTNSPAIGGPAPLEQAPVQWRGLLTQLDSLSGDLSLREDRLDALEFLILDRRLQDTMHPGGQPVDGGWISSQFGYRTHPVSGAREFHSGVDFAGKSGLDVNAVGAGIVTWSARRWGYGNMVEINHGNGFVTRYAHNKKNLVDIGDRVDKDQTIALLGSTGRSTGPHVHFEVLKDGKVVNPWRFIQQASKSQ